MTVTAQCRTASLALAAVDAVHRRKRGIEAAAVVLRQLPKTERAKIIATVENSAASLVGIPTNA